MRVLLFLNMGLISFIVASCNKSVSISEFNRYLLKPENGLIKTKSINNINYSFKFIPANLYIRGLDEYKNEELRNLYFTIRLDSDFDEDILKYGVRDYQEYNQRIQMLNFEMGEYIKLMKGENIYKPTLINFEEVYGMHKHRDLHVVFSPKVDINEFVENSKDIKLIFEDGIFENGTIIVTFFDKDIKKIPRLRDDKK